jgi:hypothetical protein
LLLTAALAVLLQVILGIQWADRIENPVRCVEDAGRFEADLIEARAFGAWPTATLGGAALHLSFTYHVMLLSR